MTITYPAKKIGSTKQEKRSFFLIRRYLFKMYRAAATIKEEIIYIYLKSYQGVAYASHEFRESTK